MNNQWEPIDELPEYLKGTRRMFAVKAINVTPMKSVPDYHYTSDPRFVEVLENCRLV